MGGTDDPANIVEVTVEQHAELHFSLYLEHGCWQDYLAAQGLAGLIDHEEAARLAVSLAHKGREPWNKGVSPSAESRAKMSESAKKRVRKPMTKEHCEAISRGKKGKKRPDVSEMNRKRWENGFELPPRGPNGQFDKKCTSTE